MPGPVSRTLALLAVLAPIASAVACSGGDVAPPVATASLTTSRTRMALGSPVELTYRFDVAPTATITGDYRVFVHVLSADGVRLWTDDHDPAIPTSAWKPGQRIEYTRTRFVPIVPYLGDATVVLGLHLGDDRLPLQGSDPVDPGAAERSYAVGTLRFLPTSDSVFVVYKTGWHPDEFSPDDAAISWKWSQKAGIFSVRNPRADVTLYLQYDARPDLFGDRVQQVSIFAGDEEVHGFDADAAESTLLRIPVTAEQFGPSDMTDFRIEVDRTFTPAAASAGVGDSRELGIRVYHLFVEQQQAEQQ